MSVIKVKKKQKHFERFFLLHFKQIILISFKKKNLIINGEN